MKVYSQERFVEAPKCILMDFDNTLYPYEPAHIAATLAVETKVAKSLNLKPKTVEEAFAEARKIVKNQLGAVAASHSRLLYFNKGLELLGLKTQPLLALNFEQTYWNIFFQNIKLYDGVITLLNALKGAGIFTCMVTDLTAQVQYRKVLYAGLETYFDYIITSEDSGQDKPSPASFELALAIHHHSPNQTWMIGDNFNADILGAKNLGITTVHFAPKPASYPNKPDCSFAKWTVLHTYMQQNGWVPY